MEHRLARATALVTLALVVLEQTAPVPSAEPAGAVLTGRVLAAATGNPLPGVRVHVGNPRSGFVRSSQPTAQDGSFSVREIPASNYELAVQSERGLYLVASPVRLAPGEARTVQLEVHERASRADEFSEDRAGGTTWWNNPLTATLIVVGSAVAIGVLVDGATDDEENPSASAPAR
jgi:hypothetical protein